ncbi:MAG: cupin domain-containing protein [Candidatus Binataceae bacterium]
MSDASKDPATGRNPAGAMLTFTIDDQIARAKAEPQWAKADRFAVSLVKHRDITVTVLLLRKGAHLKEHQARGSITLQVLEGAVRFTGGGDAQALRRGMIAALDKEIPHSVEAIEDSTVLLTASL